MSASRRQESHQLLRAYQLFLQVNEPQTLKEKEDMLYVPVLGDIGSANVDGNDETAGHCVRGACCGQVLEPWTGAILKYVNVGHASPAVHERVGDHVR